MNYIVNTLVLGAGIGGLGAASWLKEKGVNFLCVEGNEELPVNMHNGVHYLHTIPKLPFNPSLKKVTLTDGILSDGKIYHEPNLEFSLKYSEKVREIQHPSSIMDIGKQSQVYLPESNSMNDLLKEMYDYSCCENFLFGYWLNTIDKENKIAYFRNKADELATVEYKNIISTLPLDKFKTMIEIKNTDGIELKCNPVYITNYHVDKIVPNWMINLYMTDETSAYRASILNNICSVESIKPLRDHEKYQVIELLNMFHIQEDNSEAYTWWTGKVMSISIDDRIKIVEEMKDNNIYMIGRFSLWNRKLLMDSTIEQAKMVVEHIINSNWEQTKDVLYK